MGFTCVLIKEEAEGAGPQSRHQNGSALLIQLISLIDLLFTMSESSKNVDAPLPRFAANVQFISWERKFKAFLRTKGLQSFHDVSNAPASDEPDWLPSATTPAEMMFRKLSTAYWQFPWGCIDIIKLGARC